MSDSSKNSVGCTWGLGSIVAVVISAALNHSLWWGLLHFMLGSVYVMYAVLFRTHEIIPALKSMFM
jgi:chemotaxis receptor (MCP) glutamine deamidase CheD